MPGSGDALVARREEVALRRDYLAEVDQLALHGEDLLQLRVIGTPEDGILEGVDPLV
jgi:hypothetical protein